MTEEDKKGVWGAGAFLSLLYGGIGLAILGGWLHHRTLAPNQPVDLVFNFSTAGSIIFHVGAAGVLLCLGMMGYGILKVLRSPRLTLGQRLALFAAGGIAVVAGRQFQAYADHLFNTTVAFGYGLDPRGLPALAALVLTWGGGLALAFSLLAKHKNSSEEST